MKNISFKTNLRIKTYFIHIKSIYEWILCNNRFNMPKRNRICISTAKKPVVVYLLGIMSSMKRRSRYKITICGLICILRLSVRSWIFCCAVQGYPFTERDSFEYYPWFFFFHGSIRFLFTLLVLPRLEAILLIFTCIIHFALERHTANIIIKRIDSAVKINHSITLAVTHSTSSVR